eukprot:196548-Pyramimonas_sp.AAC.1
MCVLFQAEQLDYTRKDMKVSRIDKDKLLKHKSLILETRKVCTRVNKLLAQDTRGKRNHNN